MEKDENDVVESDIFSLGSLSNYDSNTHKVFDRIKGKVHLTFSAEVNNEFYERVETNKTNYIWDATEKMYELNLGVDGKGEQIKLALCIKITKFIHSFIESL